MTNRGYFLRVCSEKDISIDTGLKLIEAMRHMTEEEKEALALELINIINTRNAESEMLSALEVLERTNYEK